MEIWNEREYILWCGICGWETPILGADVPQEYRRCPGCGSGDCDVRDRHSLRKPAFDDVPIGGLVFSDNGRSGLSVEEDPDEDEHGDNCICETCIQDYPERAEWDEWDEMEDDSILEDVK